MAEQSSGLFWKNAYAEAVEPELSPLEMQLRDQFVSEYLFDYDRVKAAIRCGFGVSYAATYADQFWAEPYVQQRLREMQQAEIENVKEKDAEDERAVRASLRQALSVGPYASRVAAARQLSVILGMEAPSKSEHTINHRGGVMAVPAIASLDEWEQAAKDAQTKLVAETRE